jgi:hypothetical protein
MITDKFVVIPVRQGFVGIGSVSIDTEGNMNFVVPIRSLGTVLQKQFREGKISAVQLKAVKDATDE